MRRLDELVKKIKEAKDAYYQTGRSPYSDSEYDAMVEEAASLGYIDYVGAGPVDDIEKITHEHPMLSLDKAHTENEISEFFKKDIVAMWKADGLTISATYTDGILTRLETRGNGEVGNNIMFHANSISNLPKKINKSGKYVIDGECVILFSDFERINNAIVESERYSNPRNLAAGSLNLRDGKESAKRCLRFYAWDVIEGGGNYLDENLKEAEKLGFDTVYHGLLKFGDDYDLKQINDFIRGNAKANNMPIDGVVYKYNDIKYGKSLGMTGHHPRNSLAYKFSDDRYPTKLISVTWQVGKTGQITPVANFYPINISGRIIEKCSLHNISIMKQLMLTKGCTCYVYLANDIIPQIDYAEQDGTEEIEIPNSCPSCGELVYLDKSGESEVLKCLNDCCPGKLIGQWTSFVSKKGMDIDGLSEKTLERFLKEGFISNMFVDIYHLDRYKRDIYKMDGFGPKSFTNLMNAIEKSKDVDLIHFITAFNIPGIGEGQSKLIAARYKTFDEFVKACDNQERFDQIPGIGEVLHANIMKWWLNNHFQMMDVAKEVRFKDDFSQHMNKPVGDNRLAGKTFVITGLLSHYKNRDELKAEIEKFGGKVAGSISKSTSFLINNDIESTSSKNKKARELGIPIISEEEFMESVK